MKFCPNCRQTYDDTANVCAQCGTALMDIPTAAPAVDTTDHTAEYSAEDISNNKIVAMVCYIFGIAGVIVAAILAKESPYVQFHIRQSLKLSICEVLLVLVAAVLAFTIIVPIAAGICALIITVLEIIAFVQVCQGKAKEPAIISKLGFMK